MKQLVFILLLSWTAEVVQPDIRVPYAWRAPLVGEWSNGSLHAASIPAALLGNKKSFPSDIRIVDEKDAEWPFYMASASNGSAHIVFQAGLGSKPYLYFDSQLYRLPRYDLQRRVGPGLPAKAKIATLGARERNPTRQAAMFKKYRANLITLAIALFAAVLLLLAFQRWKKR